MRKIIHSLKLVDYLHGQADNPWYNYYVEPDKTDDKVIMFLNTFVLYVNKIDGIRKSHQIRHASDIT